MHVCTYYHKHRHTVVINATRRKQIDVHDAQTHSRDYVHAACKPSKMTLYVYEYKPCSDNVMLLHVYVLFLHSSFSSFFLPNLPKI